VNAEEFKLFNDFDFGPKVSVEIDGDLAKTLMKLAYDGAFGNEFTLTDLEPLVHHLLTNRARSGKRKRDVMFEASRQQMAQLDAELEDAAKQFNKKLQSEDTQQNETDE
jgi:hypothetical protein